MFPLRAKIDAVVWQLSNSGNKESSRRPHAVVTAIFSDATSQTWNKFPKFSAGNFRNGITSETSLSKLYA